MQKNENNYRKNCIIVSKWSVTRTSTLHQMECLLIHVHFMEQGKVSQLREAIPPGIMSLT